MPTVVRKATLKKAKADFKSRGQPTISNSERKQILRGAELDRRAWGIEQREKRKAEATLKKKQERENREKEEWARVQMGTQMRCDRFGYKSSQFHLGKFFGAVRDVKEEEELGVATAVGQEDEEDMFDDDGVDDDALLEALESPGSKSVVVVANSVDPATEVARPLYISHSQPAAADAPTCGNDMLDFWEELGSSTQIARELADDSPQPKLQNVSCIPHRNPRQTVGNHKSAPSNMTPAVASDEGRSTRDLMPPPPLPLKVRQQIVSSRAIQTHRRPPSHTSAADEATSGFTMSELEAFVDDDLQLTQVPPG